MKNTIAMVKIAPNHRKNTMWRFYKLYALPVLDSHSVI